MTWIAVRGAEAQYQVSVDGRVRRISSGRVLKPSLVAGYPSVTLSVDGRQFSRRIHVLMLEAFVGDRPPGAEARHLDDVKTNNVLSNLEWGTSAENSRDAVRNGRNANARKTHCPRDHPYDEKNAGRRPGGGRYCRTCDRERGRVQSS